MKKIAIGGVNPIEKKYLDKIWSFKSQEEFAEWLETLNQMNRIIAIKMFKMIILEMEFLEFDEKVNASDFEESKVVLEKFMGNNNV